MLVEQLAELSTSRLALEIIAQFATKPFRGLFLRGPRRGLIRSVGVLEAVNSGVVSASTSA